MNIINFIWLINEIYFKKGLPDLERIQRLGLLAIKIGQVHALRADFLDSEKCAHLAKLYRAATILPVEESRSLIKKHLSPDALSAFSEINYEPLASASVGQVHRARLNGGRSVVIKVIKENFKKNFSRDVQNVRSFFKFIIFFYPKLAKVGDPIGILEHIEEYTTNELDLRNEIRGQKILKEIYEANKNKFDLSDLDFINIYEELSGENAMVSDYIEGKTFDELLEKGELDYADLLKLFFIHGFYMFIVGTFHGDIHPGNVILNNGKISFIDTAAISHVGEKIRKGLFSFFESLSAYDYPRCAYYLNRMAEIEISGERFENFEKKFIELYRNFSRKTVSEVSLTRQMMETIKLGVNSGMKFERGMFGIIKSLMYMDGMVLKCKPDTILMEDMRGFIDEYKKAL